MSEIKEIEVDLTSSKKNVVWIDQNNNGPENKRYLQICSKVLTNYSFNLVTSVKEGYECLSKFSFQLVYVILSGRLAEEFLDSYEENLQKLNIITLNIIFCFNGKYHEKKNMQMILFITLEELHRIWKSYWIFKKGWKI